MARGFDPFRPLCINTNTNNNIASTVTTTVSTTTTTTMTANDIETASSAAGNAILAKKPSSVLYESLQHHPLHQMQVQQNYTTSTFRQQQQQLYHGLVPRMRTVPVTPLAVVPPLIVSNSHNSVNSHQLQLQRSTRSEAILPQKHCFPPTNAADTATTAASASNGVFQTGSSNERHFSVSNTLKSNSKFSSTVTLNHFPLH